MRGVDWDSGAYGACLKEERMDDKPVETRFPTWAILGAGIGRFRSFAFVYPVCPVPEAQLMDVSEPSEKDWIWQAFLMDTIAEHCQNSKRDLLALYRVSRRRL